MPNVFEETAAKAAGKFGGLQAAIGGLHGVFRRLAEEHKEVATLLNRASMCSDVEERVDLWGTIREELMAHEHAESQVVYPEVEMHASLVEIVRQHDSEAEQLEAFIHNVDRSSIASVQWEGSLKQLQEAVLHHAEREERHFFPRIQEVIGEQRAEALGERYVAAKEALLHGL